MENRLSNVSKLSPITAFKICVARLDAWEKGLSPEDMDRWAHYSVESVLQKGTYSFPKFTERNHAWREYDWEFVEPLMEKSGFSGMDWRRPLKSLLDLPVLRLEKQGFVNWLAAAGQVPETPPDSFREHQWYHHLDLRSLQVLRVWGLGEWLALLGVQRDWNIPYDKRGISHPSNLFANTLTGEQKEYYYGNRWRVNIQDPDEVREFRELCLSK